MLVVKQWRKQLPWSHATCVFWESPSGEKLQSVNWKKQLLGTSWAHLSVNFDILTLNELIFFPCVFGGSGNGFQICPACHGAWKLQLHPWFSQRNGNHANKPAEANPTMWQVTDDEKWPIKHSKCQGISNRLLALYKKACRLSHSLMSTAILLYFSPPSPGAEVRREQWYTPRDEAPQGGRNSSDPHRTSYSWTFLLYSRRKEYLKDNLTFSISSSETLLFISLPSVSHPSPSVTVSTV